MNSQGCRGGFWRQCALFGFLLLVIWTACDGPVSLLDLDRLSTFLELTPSQTEEVTAKVVHILSEVETYLTTIREARRGADEQAVIESARRRANENIRQIMQEIRALLTPDQQRRFDRVAMPDLTEFPQTLQFMVARARRATFGAIRVKPVAHVRPAWSPSTHPDSQPDTYDALKEKWTIVFGPGGFNTGLQTFPVLVTATLFDWSLIEAEIRRSAPPDSVDSQTGVARRQAYYEAHRVTEMLTIQMTLSTFLHESYTDPGRWVIYLEDDQANQYEPAEILVDAGLIPPQPSPLIPRAYRGEGGLDLSRQARQIELHFPRRDAFGHQLIQPETRALKLVLFDKNDPSSRTQGEWVFQ